MTLYADADFYSGEYLEGRIAVLDPNCINAYLRKAQMKLKNHTFDNIDESTEIPYEVKMCICEIAEILFLEDKRASETGGVTSESVSGWSRHYESSEQSEKSVESKIRNAVYTWLSDTGLLYCGVK